MLQIIVQVSAVACGTIVILLPLLGFFRSRSRLEGDPSRPKSLRFPMVFVLTLVYIAAGVLLWKPIFPAIAEPLRAILLILGSTAYFPGIALYLWGYFTLGKMFAISSSRAAALYHDHELIRSGPYRFIRHPMYLGVILAALGATMIFHTWAMILFTVTAISVIFRARQEDALLAERFGDAWNVFHAQVPAWLPLRRYAGRDED